LPLLPDTPPSLRAAAIVGVALLALLVAVALVQAGLDVIG
jgi:hypothetical protein